MKDVLVEYGDAKMPIQVPDHAVVVRHGETYTDPPAVDPVEATRKALDKPLGMPPVTELVGPGSKVVILSPTASRAVCTIAPTARPASP